MNELRQIDASTKLFSKRIFVRHFFEMFMAMVIGMVLLDRLASLVLARVSQIDLFANPGLYAPLMTVDMTIGMALWMLYRRHTFRNIEEMSGAMVLPLCLLIGFHWAGMLSGEALLGGSMALSLPAMIFVMFYRRDVCGQDHLRHQSGHMHLPETQ